MTPVCFVLFAFLAHAAEPPRTPAEPAPDQAAPAKTVDDWTRELALIEAPGELDAYIAQHPEVLTARARPNGSVLMTALQFTHEGVALALLRAGSEVPDQAMALAARGGLDDFVRATLKRGAPVNAADDFGYDALHLAVRYGKVSTVKLLLAAGADVEAQTREGWTATHIAVMNRQVEALALLLAANPNLEARDGRGRTPLHWGPFAYHPIEIHTYEDLDRPHDTTFQDPGRAVAIEMLLRAGSEIDARDNSGETALYMAANEGSWRGVEMLLEHGADRSLVTKAGRSPLDEARRRGDDEVVEMLGGKPQVSPAKAPTPP